MTGDDYVGRTKHGWRVTASHRRCLRPGVSQVVYDVEHRCGLRQRMSDWIWRWSKIRCPQCQPSEAAPTTTTFEDVQPEG